MSNDPLIQFILTHSNFVQTVHLSPLDMTNYAFQRSHMHGKNIDTVTFKSAPVNVMAYPKNGTVNATMTALMTKNVLMK
ncbi:hypothetical protein MTR67_024816 [Solanum verrucosum]|uniref:Uncharacterized protein n=1 Tax=Solanum verrucosum TaxID=315347 RepID=A0AAF0TT13_SOLVR|nr:hypothetical protein MTR67_024816 [Solanum verrucosum]